MSKFFAPNISRAGRIARAIYGMVCLAGSAILSTWNLWVCLVLAAAGIFALFEAFRGWCVMRACGIKTRL